MFSGSRREEEVELIHHALRAPNTIRLFLVSLSAVADALGHS